MSKKAPLEMTADDHKAIGSTPSRVLVDNPGKTLAETMTDAEVHQRIREAVDIVANSHTKALAGDKREKMILETVRDSFLVPDFEYLQRIGRLPDEFKSLDPAVRFAL